MAPSTAGQKPSTSRAVGQPRREPQHGGVHDEGEEPESEQRDRKREDLRDRFEYCVHEAEDDGHEEQGLPTSAEFDAVDQFSGRPQRCRVHS